MRLKDIALVKTNFPDADFWLRRSGDTNTVGEVLREFNPDAIGIQIQRTDVLDSVYARYMFQYLHMKGTWAQRASGTTVQHIRASDVANIQLGQQGVAEGRANITTKIEGNDEDGYDVYGLIDGKPVGMATFVYDEARRGWYSEATDVDPEYRRMGVATAIYNAAKEKIGRIIPSDDLSPDAEALWKNKKIWEDNEVQSLDKEKRVKDFIRWIYKKENITDPLPNIKFAEKKEAPDQHRTGYYDWHTNTMWVYTGHRNFVDVLRTLAHELIHRKQKQQKRIRQKSPPGSKLEREADAEAGMLMKLYVRKHPEVIQERQALDRATLTVQQLAQRHNVPKSVIKAQLKKGMNVELEHTSDPNIAREIALDHLKEFPDYYTRLERVEKIDEVKIDNARGAGAVPWNRNVDYQGLRVQMRPTVFLRLALTLDDDESDRKTIAYLGQIKDTQGFGAPFLEILVPDTWAEGNFRQPARVVGHDGRHRMRAILDTEGDAPIEVHLFPRRGWRRRDFTPEMIKELQSGMVSEWGRYLQGPLFDIAVQENLMMIPTAEGAGVPSLEENLLQEYDREKTAQNYGAKLAQAARQKELGLAGTQAPDSDVIEWVLTNLESGDPTANKKYLQWIVRNYIKSNTKMEDVLSTVRDQLVKFDTLLRRKKLPVGYTDINRYTSFGNFFDVMDEFEDPAEELTDRGQAETVYDDAQVRVIVPRDQTAACYYGQGTRWCTAATQGTNYFDRYNKAGPLYILLPKKPKYPGEKYQLHWSSHQFMDEKDDPVNLLELMTNFPGAEKYFLENEPDLREYIIYADDMVLESVMEQIWQLTEEYLWDLVSDWRDHDDFYFQTLRDEGYVDEEGNIDWERAPDYLEFNDELRDLFINVQSVITQGAENIKKEAAQTLDDEGDQWTVNNIEHLLAQELQSMYRHDEGSVASFLKERVSVRLDPATGKYSVHLVPWRRGMRESLAETDDDLFEPKSAQTLDQIKQLLAKQKLYINLNGQRQQIRRVTSEISFSNNGTNRAIFYLGDQGIPHYVDLTQHNLKIIGNTVMVSDRSLDENEVDEASSIHQNIKKQLAKKGYGYIQSGIDQAAFDDPDSRETVFKVFGTQPAARGENFTADQRMFTDWVKYTQAHADNPFLVRTQGYESFQHAGKPYLQIRQERLFPLDPIVWAMIDEMVDHIRGGLSFEAWLENWQEDQDLEWLERRVGGVDQIKLLFDTLADVSRYGLSKGYQPDFHSDNIMQRANGTPVIMDPWVVPRQGVTENFADGRVKGRSRPGRVKRAGASCSGSVSELRARAKKYGGERGRMYHWCANMKSGRKKNESIEAALQEMWQRYKKSK